MTSDQPPTDALPSPLGGGAGGGGRAAARTLQVKPTAWEREAEALSTARGRARANALRRRLTPPEKRLWWHLRHSLPLPGTHFRRQVAIGRYVVDFCCMGARLVVEVDGNQHGFDGNARADAERTRELQALGFRVIRFSNRDVITETTIVLDTIYAACAEVAGKSRPSHQAEGPPPPAPPRKGEGSAPRPPGSTDQAPDVGAVR